jgi:hypothetical protein
MLMIDYLLGLIDSSRKLISIYAISFIVSLHLIFLISVQTSDMTKVFSFQTYPYT